MIPILNRFDTISAIMPYYGYSHKSFLLLSSLCTTTRKKLDEFYEAFVYLMRQNLLFVEIKLDLNNLFLPIDLFGISISKLIGKTVLESFVKFIKNLNESKGWYFNKHYMHSQIVLKNWIPVDYFWIKELYHNLSILKSIQVVVFDDTYEYFKYWSSPISLDIIAKIINNLKQIII